VYATKSTAIDPRTTTSGCFDKLNAEENIEIVQHMIAAKAFFISLHTIIRRPFIKHAPNARNRARIDQIESFDEYRAS
jgi:hypothetical protein